MSNAFETFPTIVIFGWFGEWCFLNPNSKSYSIVLWSGNKSHDYTYFFSNTGDHRNWAQILNQLFVIRFINLNLFGQHKFFRENTQCNQNIDKIPLID